MCPKVSVIVPVYNAEKYITQCIESLLSQTIQRCEFIFVNDGSQDNSRQIIDKYKKLDGRIKLINQENQGVSVARNSGLSIAAGEYIGFVDADDYIEKDMYELLYNTAKESDCDVVVSNFESEIEGHKVITRYQFPTTRTLEKEYIKYEILPYFIKEYNMNTVCNKIFKKKVIRENNINFPEKVALGEDAMFNIQFFGNAIKMKYLDYTGYHYREVPGSATRNILEKDYFNKDIEVYNMSLPKIFDHIDRSEIDRLRSIKLINSVKANVYIYFKPSNVVSFCKRYKYIKNMICNKFVRQALAIVYDEIYCTIGRYEKFLICMIKRKCVFGLYFATAYSRFRNN